LAIVDPINPDRHNLDQKGGRPDSIKKVSNRKSPKREYSVHTAPCRFNRQDGKLGKLEPITRTT